MAAQLIEAVDVIDVSCLSMLIYGPPGGWKTSLAQTAENPITLDFDRGIHRAFNRQAALRFDAWADVAEAGEGSKALAGRKTLVIDTIGRMLDLLTTDIVRQNAKHGSATGGLSLQGYGVLKARFACWMGQVRQGGFDVVMIAHEKEERDGDERTLRPDIQGGSYTEVMKFTDLVGYLGVNRDGKRVLDFNPSDRHLGKNAAGWGPTHVPGLKEHPQFLANLLADAKFKIGKTAEASAALATVLDQWTTYLATTPKLAGFNDEVKELVDLPKPVKVQVWALVKRHAENRGWEFDRHTKEFKEGVVAA